MKTLTDQLTQYAFYHQDPRNVQTHFVGVPMILASVVFLLSRLQWGVGSVSVSLAMVLALCTTVFYLRLDMRYGCVLGLVFAVLLVAGHWLAAQSLSVWLIASIGLFVVGWIIQFVGHYFEGKKPAFVDDLVGLLIGPLFVTAELGFLMQMRPEIKAEIHRRLKNIQPVQAAG
jgi:uncharacterized membrane protein YGL010W